MRRNFRSRGGRGGRSAPPPVQQAEDDYTYGNPVPVPRSQPPARQSSSRARYQKQRADKFHQTRNKEFVERTSEELKNRLLPGIRDESNAAKQRETINAPRATIIPTTTRAQGFGTYITMSAIFMRPTNQIPVAGNSFSLYRIALAVASTKYTFVQRELSLPFDNTYALWPRLSADTINTVLSHTILPDPIIRAVRPLGIYNDRETQFVPALSKDTIVNERFVPRPENVHLLNLRRTVEALADPNTPAIQRKRFYDHNPLPYAWWQFENNNQNSPILANPNDFMPVNYDYVNDLQNDYDRINAKQAFLANAYSKYIGAPLEFNGQGNVEILSSNELENLRCPDRLDENEAEQAYYLRTTLTGNVTKYWNLRSLRPTAQLEACYALLGELPTTVSQRYPSFSLREQVSSTEIAMTSFNSARSSIYA